MVLRSTGSLQITSLTFSIIGLVIIAGALVLYQIGRWRRWGLSLPSLSTLLSLGLVAPAYVIYLPLAQRALADPVPIVLTPAAVALAMLIVSIGTVVVTTLLQQPPAARGAAAMLPALIMPLWLNALVVQPDEILVTAALAVIFGLAALVWLATRLLLGWWALAPTLLAIVVCLVMVIDRLGPPPGITGNASYLTLTHLFLAIIGPGLLVGLPAIGLWRRDTRPD